MPEPSNSLPRRIRLSDFLESHPRAITRATVLSRWPRASLDAAMRAGRVSRILPGIYCAAIHTRHPRVMGEALNLWAPRGVVTGGLALHLCDPELPAPAQADLLVPHGDHMRSPAWVRIRQVRELPPVAICSGVRCATPERALLDAWARAAPAARRDVLYAALWARVCTWQQLARAVQGEMRIHGRGDLERVLGWFAEGATSPLEVRAKHETFADARFREFEWQVPLQLKTRRPVADMLHRAARLVVELDGDRYHSSRDARQTGRERDLDLAAAGYQTIRFGWHDICGRPQWCQDRLLAVVASRLSGQ